MTSVYTVRQSGGLSLAMQGPSVLFWPVGSELEAAAKAKQELLEKLGVPSGAASPGKVDEALRVEDLREGDLLVSTDWLGTAWAPFLS